MAVLPGVDSLSDISTTQGEYRTRIEELRAWIEDAFGTESTTVLTQLGLQNIDNTADVNKPILNFSVATGTGNAIALASPQIASYQNNQIVFFQALADNTTATTIAVNGLSPAAVVVGNAALSGGEILAGGFYAAYYNTANTNFELKDLNGGELDINGLASKTTPVDADELVIADSATSFGLKKLSWVNLKATLKTFFDTIYSNLGVNQSRQDVTAGRVIGSTYPNNTGHPMEITIRVLSQIGAGLYLSVDGNRVQDHSGGSSADRGFFNIIIEDGSDYGVFVDAGSVSISSWFELKS